MRLQGAEEKMKDFNRTKSVAKRWRDFWKQIGTSGERF